MGLHVKLDMQDHVLLRVECVRVSYDNLDRQIVVITHASEMYGRSSEHLRMSHMVRVQSPHKR